MGQTNTPYDSVDSGPVAAKQGKIISPQPPCLNVGMRSCVCADMPCLVFAKRGAVHNGQTSPLWSHLSKGHCFRSVEVCSDAIFANQSHAVMFLLERRSLFLETTCLPNMP